MDLTQIEEIRKLIELVIHSKTKADAKPHANRLDFAVTRAKSTLNPYFAGKLREAATYANEASGQVKNKEHWISCMQSSWYVFESHIRQKQLDTPEKN